GRAGMALASALSFDPQNPTALGLRALAELDAGRPDDAEVLAAQCLDQHPDQHEALLVAGTTALWKRNLERSGAAFERALQRHPNSGRALAGMGQLHMLQGRLDQARELLEHAVATMPDHIGTWHALAWTQLLMGDRRAAERSYRRAYDLDRNFAESHGGLALIAVLDGDSATAETQVKKALRLDQTCITARYARCLLLEDAGETEQASRLLGELFSQGALPDFAGADLGEFSRRLRARLSAAEPS